jgi:hypothetical protein
LGIGVAIGLLLGIGLFFGFTICLKAFHFPLLIIFKNAIEKKEKGNGSGNASQL